MKTDMVFKKFLEKLWDWGSQSPEAKSILPSKGSTIKLLPVIGEVDVGIYGCLICVWINTGDCIVYWRYSTLQVAWVANYLCVLREIEFLGQCKVLAGLVSSEHQVPTMKGMVLLLVYWKSIWVDIVL